MKDQKTMKILRQNFCGFHGFCAAVECYFLANINVAT